MKKLNQEHFYETFETEQVVYLNIFVIAMSVETRNTVQVYVKVL